MKEEVEWLLSVLAVFGAGAFWGWVWTCIAQRYQWFSDDAAMLIAFLVLACTFVSLCLLALLINYIRSKVEGARQ